MKYIIDNNKVKDIFLLERAWHVKKKLDIVKINSAAGLIIGKNDFSSFRAKFCHAKSPITEILSCNIIENANIIEIHIRAVSFLYHMVRNIVGTFVDIGLNKIELAEMNNIIAAKKRVNAGQTAPACGLYFVEAHY